MIFVNKVISLSSDFGVANKGIAVMEAVALSICPDAKIFQLSHGIPGFSLRQGARVLEAVAYLPIGCHVMVVDPGVGTKRKGIVIETKRGDYLIGPDNGVLLPATRFLGGFKRALELANEKYYRKPVSPVFHGRDVFTPVAAHLCAGVPVEEFGPELKEKDLVKAIYSEAEVKRNRIEAEIIDVNNFGNIFFNIKQDEMHKLFSLGEIVNAKINGKKIKFIYKKTFGDVGIGKAVIMDDDYGRIEAALNMGNLMKKFKLKMGEKIVLEK